MSIIVNFYIDADIPNALLKFAVIVTRYNGKWIFCRHKLRDTYEIPGGHRELGENIDDTAKRELKEETGAINFTIEPISVYSVTKEGIITYGKLFFAEIYSIGELSKEMEIGEIIFTDNLPEKLTYPAIQPYLYEKVKKIIEER